MVERTSLNVTLYAHFACLVTKFLHTSLQYNRMQILSTDNEIVCGLRFIMQLKHEYVMVI